jgi:esterase/lipase
MMRKWGSLFNSVILPLQARHLSSGFNAKFHGDNLNFNDYISSSLEMVRKVRGNLNSDISSKTIEGNAPFALEPHGNNTSGSEKKYSRGILLTHGLSDSPYFMRHLATFFQECGFRVLAILLPGHGTQPGDLLDVTWQEWDKAIAYGTDKLASEVDEVYLGGYSAGGALSILQSLRDNRVRGLYLFAPALQITQHAAYAKLHKLISWLLPRRKWVYIKPDNDLYKYESFAKNTAAQMYALTRTLQKKLHKQVLHIPIFAVTSEDDKTVYTEATIEFMSKQPHPLNRLLLYTTNLEKIHNNSSEARLEWLYSVVPEQKILSSAHTAILLSADDEHYGLDGEYANCVHYFPENMEKYAICSNTHSHCSLGELTEQNLQTGIVRRLMYNPNFASLKSSIKQFMKQIS